MHKMPSAVTHSLKARLLAGIVIVFAGVAVADTLFNLFTFPNPSGVAATLDTAGKIDPKNPFFQTLGTNDRTCASCHQLTDGMSVTPAHIKARFMLTSGTDPIFRPVDGANCPSADVSTREAREASYSLLLNKGLIRIALNVPQNAEFSITAIDDPYQCKETTANQPAFYRRPLPASNLRFLSTVMWDGRESAPAPPDTAPTTINDALIHQATDATEGHAQGQAPTQDQLQAILDFETSLYTAQQSSSKAGDLSARGAQGGAAALSTQPFSIGINDSLTPGAFNPNAFTIFQRWANLPGNDEDSQRRRSIARGEQLFNTKPIAITGVTGLNDALKAPTIPGTCTTCHDSPNAGDHSKSLALNIGVSDASRRTPDLPLYTVQCNLGPHAGETYQTTDIGRAMISGKCADIGKLKGPVLRGLSARAPYFHNGSAATLMDAITFYDQRFNIGLTDQEKADLVAFLSSL